MNDAEFQDRFQACTAALLQLPAEDADETIWSRAGMRDRDIALSALADLYLTADGEQQRAIREQLAIGSAWAMVLYVRRVAMRIESEADSVWLQRGLAIAAIVNRRTDYRDLIVSLVILRHGAERVGISTARYFDAAIAAADPRLHDILKNARDHAPRDIALTLAAFGPPEWSGN